MIPNRDSAKRKFREEDELCVADCVIEKYGHECAGMSETEHQGCPVDALGGCRRRYWTVVAVIIACSLGAIGGRILGLGNVARDELPFFSANDRSRWANVRALGDYGTWEIDRVLSQPDGRRWDSIDKVRHADSEGALHYYSSKPPFLASIWAAEYRLLRSLTGLKFSQQPVWVMRILLLFNHSLLWLLMMVALGKLLLEIPGGESARYFVVASAGFGTFLTTFAVTLNNHLPAAASAMVALWAAVEIGRRGRGFWWYAAMGLASALTAVNELPALSFLVAMFALALWWNWKRTLLGFLPAAALVVGCFLITNWAAHGSWKMPYAHRGDGALIGTVDGELAERFDRGLVPDVLANEVESETGRDIIRIERADWPRGYGADVDRWIAYDTEGPVVTILKSPDSPSFEIRTWDNWYDYPGSYWRASNRRKSQVDLGEPDRARYAFHLLLGHHGFFSLTPLWILGLAGLLVLAVDRRWKLRWFGAAGLILSLVVISFYVSRPLVDRNYGGFTSTPRWLLWLAPFYLIGLVPVVHVCSRNRWLVGMVVVVLCISVASAHYAADNPWSHPWIYEWWFLPDG